MEVSTKASLLMATEIPKTEKIVQKLLAKCKRGMSEEAIAAANSLRDMYVFTPSHCNIASWHTYRQSSGWPDEPFTKYAEGVQ